tara:strand:+ start:9215 stop:9544 length:330 start_codon:yes stop_codon:yes gene_type:complete
MNNKEILDNAPLPDWTHHNDDIDSDVACFYSYIKQVEGINGQEFYKLGFDGKRKVWKQCAGIYNTTRSRIDIERIAELEKQIEFKIKECQELASSCNRWKLEALKEKGE